MFPHRSQMVASASAAASLVSRARGSIAMGGHTNTRIQMTNTVMTQIDTYSNTE